MTLTERNVLHGLQFGGPSLMRGVELMTMKTMMTMATRMTMKKTTMKMSEMNGDDGGDVYDVGARDSDDGDHDVSSKVWAK